MTEVCADNRFEIIADYKRRLVEETNIETKSEEMAVLDSILFRFWQMGWLKEQQAMEPRSMSDCAWQYSCGECKKPLYAHGFAYCPWCGRKVKWDAAD